MIPGNRHDAISTQSAAETKSDVHGANSCRNKSGLEDKGDMTRLLYVATATSFLRERGLFCAFGHGFLTILSFRSK